MRLLDSLYLLLATGTAVSATKTDDVNPKSDSLFSFSELWDLEKTFWDAFLYPANLNQINATDEVSVFAPDVQGRVDITRTFNGSELNQEYIFGLFSDPDHVSLTGVPIAYNITQFTANDNIASATTVVTFNATTFQAIFPVTIDTWIMFNDDGKIIQYDATFRWFEYLLDAILAKAAQDINATTASEPVGYITKTLATTICQTHKEYCTGENQQYDNSTQCYDFLTQDTRFGKSYELGRDTLLCREVHEHMVPYRPDVHCPHIGPTGGGYCVDDRDYEQTVLEKYFEQSWMAFGVGDEQNVWLV